MDYNWGSSGLEVIASYNWSGPQHGSSPILGEAFDHWLGFCWRSWLWSLLRKWIWSLCRETQLALGPLLSQGEWLTPGGGMLGGGRSWGLQPGGRVAGGLEPITTAALEAAPEKAAGAFCLCGNLPAFGTAGGGISALTSLRLSVMLPQSIFCKADLRHRIRADFNSSLRPQQADVHLVG